MGQVMDFSIFKPVIIEDWRNVNPLELEHMKTQGEMGLRARHEDHMKGHTPDINRPVLKHVEHDKRHNKNFDHMNTSGYHSNDNIKMAQTPYPHKRDRNYNDYYAKTKHGNVKINDILSDHYGISVREYDGIGDLHFGTNVKQVEHTHEQVDEQEMVLPLIILFSLLLLYKV